MEVIQCGSFSAAARKLGTTPSAVTRQIAKLEESLAVKLLNRTTRSMELTQSGRIYHERAMHLVRQYEEMNQEIAALEAEPRGLLRVSASLSLGTTRLSDLMPEFLDRYPLLSVELALTDRIVDLIEDKVDVAVRISPQLPDSSLVARKLFKYERVICASPSYISENGLPKKPDDLKDHNCLTFLTESRSGYLYDGKRTWVLRLGGKQVEVPVKGRLSSNSLAALTRAAISGAGLFLVPTWLVDHYIHAGDLQVVLPEYETNPRADDTWVFAVYGSSQYLSPKIRVFTDFIAEKFSK